jgi:serine/threonine-protein kinase
LKDGFRWCPHCGGPHTLADRICAATGKGLDSPTAKAPRSPHGPAGLIGTVLDGKYRVLRVLGSGGMGVVLEAENLAQRRLVAIKVGSRADSAEARLRLEREAQIVGSLQHPHLCELHEVGHLPSGGPYIVLERLFGETLAEHLQSTHHTTVREVVEIMVQALSGLQVVHDARILHRDLKPQNIFLAQRIGDDPIVKLLDFGFARDVSARERITRPGKACGTMQYMSPEQLRGDALDYRSDLFAAGVVLYEAIAARHPFAGTSRLDMVTKIVREEPRPLSERRPNISPALEAVVTSALAKDPSRRPASARAMGAALEAAMPALPSRRRDDDDAASSHAARWIPPSSTPPA